MPDTRKRDDPKWASPRAGKADEFRICAARRQAAERGRDALSRRDARGGSPTCRRHLRRRRWRRSRAAGRWRQARRKAHPCRKSSDPRRWRDKRDFPSRGFRQIRDECGIRERIPRRRHGRARRSWAKARSRKARARRERFARPRPDTRNRRRRKAQRLPMEAGQVARGAESLFVQEKGWKTPPRELERKPSCEFSIAQSLVVAIDGARTWEPYANITFA